MADALPPVPAVSAGDAEKKLGNEAFAAKDFEKAIGHYEAAIKIDPENPFFYSNLSACYASLKKWTEALEAAVQCVSKDDKFVKGYMRLAAAQTELSQYEDAERTLRAALTLDPTNALIGQLIRKLKEKKTGIVASKPKRQLDDQQRKELYELQEQTSSYTRDLRAVIARLNGLSREAAATDNTQNQLKEFPASTKLYRGIGKVYVLQNRNVIDECLETEINIIDKNYKDLQDRKEYLERRIQSNQTNLRDLTAGL
jgi:tetratricopeptide (TPR) repeat protein